MLIRGADEGARVALALLALQRTGSAAVAGGLVAALLLPHVLAAPMVGALTDRARRPGSVIAGAALIFSTALAIAAVGVGHVPLPVVFAALLIGGCSGPALTGALSGQLPVLVLPERLPRAFGVDSLTYNVGGVVGPALAGVVSGVSSAAVATCVLAGSAAVGAVFVVALPIPRRTAPSVPVRRSDLVAGVAVVARDKILATVTAATSIGQLGLGALPVIVAVLAEREHRPALAGLLLTGFAAGAVLGSLAWTWRPGKPESAPAVVMAGLVGVGVPLAVAASTTSLPVLVGLFGLSGIANGPLFGALLATRQHWAQPDLRNQVFTLGAGAKITASAGGAALAGVLSGGPTALQLLLAASCPIAAGLLGLASVGRRPGRRGGHRRRSPTCDQAASPSRSASSSAARSGAGPPSVPSTVRTT